jgi:hypothetical protein
LQALTDRLNLVRRHGRISERRASRSASLTPSLNRDGGFRQRRPSADESIAGATLDPWWDLYALLHHDDSGPKWIRGQIAGRRPVDVSGMTSRVEIAIEMALRRLG